MQGRCLRGSYTPIHRVSLAVRPTLNLPSFILNSSTPPSSVWRYSQCLSKCWATVSVASSWICLVGAQNKWSISGLRNGDCSAGRIARKRGRVIRMTANPTLIRETWSVARCPHDFHGLSTSLLSKMPILVDTRCRDVGIREMGGRVRVHGVRHMTPL